MNSWLKLGFILIINLAQPSFLLAEPPEPEGKELSGIFYRQALRAAWVLRVEKAVTSPDETKKGQFKELTELAFRYWIYSSKGIIERDLRFEKLMYDDFKLLKKIPHEYLDIPLPGKIQKSIPGFRWSNEEFGDVSHKFKKYILDLDFQSEAVSDC